MRILTFTNARGESLRLDGTNHAVSSVSGLGDVDSDTQMQKAPYMDGQTYIDSILQPRPISIEGGFSSLDPVVRSKQRQYMQRVLNPKLGPGTLRYEHDGGIKEITAVADGAPAFPDKGQNPFQMFLINLLCPDPYWRDLNQTSRALQAYVGNFTLPFTLPFELGYAGDRTTLLNEGDVPAPVRIDIHGPTTNPQVINRTTGEFIKVNRSIAANEILHINTTPGQKRVEVYRDGDTIINAFGNFAHAEGATFWQLELGPNEIEHIADAGRADATVAVSWHNLYAGI